MTKTQLIKNARRALSLYNVSRETTLDDCYKSYSVNKQRAFNRCRGEMYYDGGYDMRIITHNVNIFTCGYLYTDPKTGVLMFRYITPNYSISIEI